MHTPSLLPRLSERLPERKPPSYIAKAGRFRIASILVLIAFCCWKMIRTKLTYSTWKSSLARSLV
ncbi:hypothetical protein JB92DRAFT_2888410 [Gautieria morchelliformis]|nr:hypothetical protein JB92DRAFT_2888410 [Gautieria morchelliformis]